MTGIADPEFLARLKNLFTHPSSLSISSYTENPWFIVTAVSFASSNRPEAVPKVLEYVLRDLDELQKTEMMVDREFEERRKRVVLRMREAIMKGGLMCGYSRVCAASPLSISLVHISIWSEILLGYISSHITV